jgi:hypothetical protein
MYFHWLQRINWKHAPRTPFLYLCWLIPLHLWSAHLRVFFASFSSPIFLPFHLIFPPVFLCSILNRNTKLFCLSDFTTSYSDYSWFEIQKGKNASSVITFVIFAVCACRYSNITLIISYKCFIPHSPEFLVYDCHFILRYKIWGFHGGGEKSWSQSSELWCRVIV